MLPPEATSPEPGAVGFKEVFAKENEQINARREALEIPAARGRLGVALSGGGIRSGTFNLGILQGLAAKGLLPHVDYLSTVSGGGYIGTWLHGVIKRQGQGNPAKVKDLLARPDAFPHATAGDPIVFLRKYSSYLAPSLGIFSADFWVILVIWLRNMLLNQLILIPFLATFSLAVVCGGMLRGWIAAGGGFQGIEYAGASLIVVLGGLSAVLAGRGAGRTVRAKLSSHPRREVWDGAAVGWTCTGLLLVASVLIATMSSWLAPLRGLWQFVSYWLFCFLLLILIQRLGGYVYCYGQQHHERKGTGWLFLFLWPIIAGGVTAGLFYAAIHVIAGWETAVAGTWHVIAWGPPLIMLLWLAGVGLHVGLMGRDFPDDGREWLARVGAYLSMGTLAWLVLFGITIFGPWWLARLTLVWGKTVLGMIGAWAAATFTGVFSGASAKTSGSPDDPKGNKALEIIGSVAPAIFVIGMMLAIAFGVHAGLRAAAGKHGYPCNPCQAAVPEGGSASADLQLKVGLDRAVHVSANEPRHAKPDWLVPIVADYWCVLGSSGTAGQGFHPDFEAWGWAGVFLVGSMIILFFFQWRIDINEFSLHHFYKNRLVRCYLGAARGSKRKPSAMTGFDPADDFPLAELRAEPDPVEGKHPKPYNGPYPIVNGTVNLDRGSDLAKQERKGESFVFTPLYCGFDAPDSPADERAVADKTTGLDKYAYTSTWNYMYERKGPDIGTCMGISGAAANPNWGYHTSAPIAFLLTVFDVRLGWWVGNPRRRNKSILPGPRFALWPLISELFAQTNERANYLNISDGGHFENLGVYELVRRRCCYVIAGDGEQDTDLTFESLGGAVRKCRVDFGVDIQIDPRRIRKKNGLSQIHCVVGKIQYPPAPHLGFPEATVGWLLYLKASLVGDEPEDVTQYHAAHPDFPQETTANQFFTESQFESYRKLGLHVLESAFDNVTIDPAKLNEPGTLDRLFERLWEQLYPPSDIPEGAASRHADAYSALMKRLNEDTDLKKLEPQVIRPENPDPQKIAVTFDALPEAVKDKGFYYCLELIQLMENVWADLHLYNSADRDSPRNGGWAAVFKYWVNQPLFEHAWKRAGKTYNNLFQDFFTMMVAKKSN
jgi:hypothetical protein